MLVGVAVVLIVGIFSRPKDSASVVSQLPAPSSPLYKPEPASLLSNPQLRLSGDQRTRIGQVDAKWQHDKAELLSAMARIQPKQGRVDQVSAGLKDYSQLSRDYDAARSRYWAAAVALLTSSQQGDLKQ